MTRRPPEIPERVLREAWIAYQIARLTGFGSEMSRAEALGWWRKHKHIHAPAIRTAAAVILAWERGRKEQGR